MVKELPKLKSLLFYTLEHGGLLRPDMSSLTALFVLYSLRKSLWAATYMEDNKLISNIIGMDLTHYDADSINDKDEIKLKKYKSLDDFNRVETEEIQTYRQVFNNFYLNETGTSQLGIVIKLFTSKESAIAYCKEYHE